MRFAKYSALGNDYLVIPIEETGTTLSPEQVRRLCDRHYGIGADGVLLGPLPSKDADFGLRLFNPDGCEFEKSGNGLRIFSSYLWDNGLVTEAPFTVDTIGGKVSCNVLPGGKRVRVEMGKVSFHSRDIPVLGPEREVVDEELILDENCFRVCAATIGNPHCVVICDEISPQVAQFWGPIIECNPMFPNRTNVQFMKVLDRNNIIIEIWERGAGYTFASGSSSCVAAASARKLGLCDANISVHVVGGILDVSLSDGYEATLEGGVVRICEGIVYDER